MESISRRARTFWAFVAPKQHAVPEIRNTTAWPKSTIDRFLLAKLDEKGLKPVGDADKRTLIRRVYLDLTGLPPTPEDVEAFVEDASAECLREGGGPAPRVAAVRRALGPPLARRGPLRREHRQDRQLRPIPHAWRYRDYVIAAFNADKPYDQFIKEQLAGDLMPAATRRREAERIIATGFLALGPQDAQRAQRHAVRARRGRRADRRDLRRRSSASRRRAPAATTTSSIPIPQKDYYALAGIFRSTETCYGTVRFIQSQRPSQTITLPARLRPAARNEREADRRRTGADREADRRPQQADRGCDRPDPHASSRTAQWRCCEARLDAFDADGNPKLLAMGVTRQASQRRTASRPSAASAPA